MASRARPAPDGERRFYTRMAIFMIVLMLIGFGPSFYLRGVVVVPRPNPSITPMVLLHGVAFTAWMLLFLAQTMFVSGGRRDLHIRLGTFGMGLAALLIPLMYIAAVGQVARANHPPFATPLGWTAIPLFIIPAFAALLWLGWRNRRRADAHKRLMLSAALMMMDPAIGRLPILPPSFASQCALSMLAWATFIPLFVHDWRSLGRVHWATITGASLFAIALSLRMLALEAPAWAEFASVLPGV